MDIRDAQSVAEELREHIRDNGFATQTDLLKIICDKHPKITMGDVHFILSYLPICQFDDIVRVRYNVRGDDRPDELYVHQNHK